MKPKDPLLNVQGKSLFIDDLPLAEETLYGAVIPSPSPHGRIIGFQTDKALTAKGVKAVLRAQDISGTNQIGNVILDELLFAEQEVHFLGQPLGLIVAESASAARLALSLLEIKIEELAPIFDPREAFAQNAFIAPPITVCCGDIDQAWQQCAHIFAGTASTGGQEHVYFETQSALAFPVEGGGIKILSSTQAPNLVQVMTARVLGLPMHQIEVDVARLGGAFGGKEDQATAWAVMAALASQHTGKPVKIVLERHEDMIMTGKRHPYSADYKIGLSEAGKILAFETTYYQDAGASADLSTAILERSMLHATNSYYIPNVKITGACCRTNTTPNTAFRGFGAPQAMFIMEAAIHHAAKGMNIEAEQIQRANLLKEGDTLPCGMPMEPCNARKCLHQAKRLYDIKQTKQNIQEFNTNNRLYKKGMALMPVCFGISFTTTFLNQAGALVHVYTDGSVSISTGAIEMGQGVNEKIASIAARTFSLSREKIKIESTNTTRIANASPTAASSGADLNGNATQLACLSIAERLKKVASEKLGGCQNASIEFSQGMVSAQGCEETMRWEELVRLAYINRVNLSAQAYYATPHIWFDKSTGKGKPFAYHVYGLALVEVTLDALRGTYSIDSVRLVHDSGKSLHPQIDQGQIEGAVVQGLGWTSLETLCYGKDGRLLTDSLSSYKIPDLYFAPENIEISFLEDSQNAYGPFHSKAIGEPPFMYGIGAYFALANAMRAFDPDIAIKYDAPWTPEKVFMALKHQQSEVH
ncbi:MAG: molybdopterin cofactor-binding domain-containing protein [Candidatus Electrothrix aestuarii]|uniref:Molybdopterin cofactor-binding domain-containing protein n=1 Tax=Candidatus Electrothrix aestuarii TaxID=3062594 RepID=A0AAU8LRC5_9BACT|nr:molybdopterin cofactor-binding domain-containing protein [Candidatus Electrothrix aestuarii]